MTDHLFPWAEGTQLPEDITAAIGRDNKPENRVFRCASGHFVKIKTDQLPSLQLGLENYFMTGALCDERGQALLDADGAPLIVPPGRGFAVNGWIHDQAVPKVEQIRQSQLAYALHLQGIAVMVETPLPAGVAPIGRLAAS